MKRPAGSVSVDLDDLWAYRRSFGEAAAAPGNGPSLWPLALPRFMALMQRQGLAGTVFVVGADLGTGANRVLLRDARGAGHEVANHSFGHADDLERWSAPRLRDDIGRAHAAIGDACGAAPVGFRAPSFRLSAALIETLQALGYAYDSSAFSNTLAPLARRWQRRRAAAGSALGGHGQQRRWPLRPFMWSDAAPHAAPLVELPVTSLPGLRLPLHGTYLQHLADHAPGLARGYAGFALRACAATGTPLHLLLHATDFVGSDDGLPVERLPGMRRPWRAKVALVEQMVAAMRGRFVLGTLAQAAAAARTLPAAPRHFMPAAAGR